MRVKTEIMLAIRKKIWKPVGQLFSPGAGGKIYSNIQLLVLAVFQFITMKRLKFSI